MWSSFQLALAGLDRVSAVLRLESNMPVVPAIPGEPAAHAGSLLAFEQVSFSYPGGIEMLRDTTFALERGKTYALVGPTGGGKTTTASLMARLYDPTRGRVLLDGRDIRTYQSAERAQKVGFILQEPFLFTGSIRDNILYGNDRYRNYPNDQVVELLTERNLDGLLSRFAHGLETKVTAGGDGISLGQKQLIAFMRAVLRDPEILILDEATANIDTVTEQLLEQILAKLPPSTTKVIIAHRLNTIANADEIFFVNGGDITRRRIHEPCPGDAPARQAGQLEITGSAWPARILHASAMARVHGERAKCQGVRLLHGFRRRATGLRGTSFTESSRSRRR